MLEAENAGVSHFFFDPEYFEHIQSIGITYYPISIGLVALDPKIPYYYGISKDFEEHLKQNPALIPADHDVRRVVLPRLDLVPGKRSTNKEIRDDIVRYIKNNAPEGNRALLHSYVNERDIIVLWQLFGGDPIHYLRGNDIEVGFNDLKETQGALNVSSHLLPKRDPLLRHNGKIDSEHHRNIFACLSNVVTLRPENDWARRLLPRTEIITAPEREALAQEFTIK